MISFQSFSDSAESVRNILSEASVLDARRRLWILLLPVSLLRIDMGSTGEK